MNEPKTFTVVEIVNQLIGDYSAHGECYHDEEALQRLDEVDELLGDVLSNLRKLADLKDDYRGSIQKLGKRANDILVNYNDIFEGRKASWENDL